jgi:serine/threonine-protein kinase
MAPPLAAGATVAGWRLLRPLGAGAHSQVWLARRGDDVVALKLQPLPGGAAQASAAAAFLRAAALARGLRHPAIVAVWDAGLAGDDGTLAWLAMEPVPGSDLQRYTREPRLLPEPVVLRVLQRVAAGLAHAHAQGVLHRDLKPANVIVNWADDAVRIVDFGLARSLGASHTGTGVVPGTPAYMAPEQLSGAEPDARADLYALGAMAFELLAGRLPHEAATMGELLRRVAQEPVPDLAALRPAVNPALAALVAGLLARARSQRPPDAGGVADALAALLPGGPPSRRAGSHAS